MRAGLDDGNGTFFGLTSSVGSGNRIPCGGTARHTVGIINYKLVEVDVGFVSRTGDDSIEYPTGDTWTSPPRRLGDGESRNGENIFEFAEAEGMLSAAASAHPGQMTQLLISAWRRELPPVSMIDYPVRDHAENVTLT